MTSLLQKINTLDTKVDGLDSSNLQTQITTNTNDISTLQTSKQNTLTAGDNITIVGDTISSTGGGSGTDIGFLAYHDSATDYSAVRVAPYNLVIYNTGNAYDNSTYIFTVPVAGKYYFYATYFTKNGSKGVFDLRIKKPNQNEQVLNRGQEGNTTPGLLEKRQVSVIVECDVNDQLFAVIRYNTVRLSVYNNSPNQIYGPYGCQLLT
jgi:hypothetical protein